MPSFAQAPLPLTSCSGRYITQATKPQAVFAAVCDGVGTAAGHPHFC